MKKSKSISIDPNTTQIGDIVADNYHTAGIFKEYGIDIWLGPRALKLMNGEPDSIRTQRFRKPSSWVGRIILLLGLAFLYNAITLVRG